MLVYKGVATACRVCVDSVSRLHGCCVCRTLWSLGSKRASQLQDKTNLAMENGTPTTAARLAKWQAKTNAIGDDDNFSLYAAAAGITRPSCCLQVYCRSAYIMSSRTWHCIRPCSCLLASQSTDWLSARPFNPNKKKKFYLE